MSGFVFLDFHLEPCSYSSSVALSWLWILKAAQTFYGSSIWAPQQLDQELGKGDWAGTLIPILLLHLTPNLVKRDSPSFPGIFNSQWPQLLYNHRKNQIIQIIEHKNVDFLECASIRSVDWSYCEDWNYNVISQIKKPQTVQTDLLLFFASSAVNVIKGYSYWKS